MNPGPCTRKVSILQLSYTPQHWYVRLSYYSMTLLTSLSTQPTPWDLWCQLRGLDLTLHPLPPNHLLVVGTWTKAFCPFPKLASHCSFWGREHGSNCEKFPWRPWHLWNWSTSGPAYSTDWTEPYLIEGYDWQQRSVEQGKSSSKSAHSFSGAKGYGCQWTTLWISSHHPSSWNGVVSSVPPHSILQDSWPATFRMIIVSASQSSQDYRSTPPYPVSYVSAEDWSQAYEEVLLSAELLPSECFF